MYTFAKLSVLSRIVWFDPLVRQVTLSEHLLQNTDCCWTGGVSVHPFFMAVADVCPCLSLFCFPSRQEVVCSNIQGCVTLMQSLFHNSLPLFFIAIILD